LLAEVTHAMGKLAIAPGHEMMLAFKMNANSFRDQMLSHTMFAGIAIIAIGSSASAQVARFEEFTEGATDTALFDSTSGISLFGSTSATQTFVIDTTAASAQLPMTTPGNILTSDGFAPGDAFALATGFGFTAVLPEPTDRLSFDVIYSTTGAAAGSFDLVLCDEESNVLATLPQTLLVRSFAEAHIEIPTRAQRDVYLFSISNVNGLALAYDNISAPEPSLAIAGLPLLTRFRRRR
jgi:hypothetical protein